MLTFHSMVVSIEVDLSTFVFGLKLEKREHMINRFEAFTKSITQLYKQLQRIKTQEMIEFDLKGVHVMILFELHRNENGLTITELADACEEDKAAISRNVANLVERGYVETVGDKKYRAPIVLTEEGKKVAERIDEMVVKAVIAVDSGLTEKKQKEFYDALNTISTNLGNYLEQLENK